MGSKRTLASLSAWSSPMLYMFRSSSGKLQRQLRKGEFAMFKHMPVFESDFIQVSRRSPSIPPPKWTQDPLGAECKDVFADISMS